MTSEEYISQGKEKTEKKVWFWPTGWYVAPYALGFREWDKYYAYLSAQYPVQRFLRETYDNCYYSVGSNYRFIKRKIKNFLRHPRKEFRNAVFDKSGEIDIVEIIVLFHLGCVVELVEREKYLEHTCSETEKEIQFVKQLKEAYDYAKGGRQKLLDDIDNHALSLENDNFTAYIEMDKHLNECDTVLCDFVVKNREKFWT
jgi:hypothetical protein